MHQLRTFIMEPNKAVRDALVLRLGREPLISIVGRSDLTLLDFEKVESQLTLFGLPNRSARADAHLHKLVERIAQRSPVIVLDGYLNEESSQRFLNAGASDYLLKETNLTPLLNSIHSFQTNQSFTHTDSGIFIPK